MALINKIADTRDDELQLKGIQPIHQKAYGLFKGSRFVMFMALGFLALCISMIFVESLYDITHHRYFPFVIIFFGLVTVISFILVISTFILFLRKPPFDDWVFEVAQKRLGTQTIFYNSKCLYIGYDVATAKEVDKKDFVTEMSDKSNYYSYFYVNTFIDQQVIQVECTKRQPIPERAMLNLEEDLHPNIIPVGLTINHLTQRISPISWTLNPNEKNPEFVETMPSVSFIICGGPLALGTIIPTTKGYKTMKTIEVGDEVFDINNNATKVIKVENINFNPTKVYKLIFNRKDEMISVISDNIHRFPKIIDDRIYLSTTEELQIGDTIIDSSKYYNKDYVGWKLVNKSIIESEPVRCIAVNSEFHLFLITDEMNKNWKGGNSYPYKAILTKNTGCHIAGEEILMADGTIKKVEDIVVGDFLTGPDKEPREVLELHKGQDEMFEIETEDGDKHIVNKGHNLQLLDIETGEQLDMPVEIYIQTSDEYKKKVRLIKVC